jgi:signal transduction histidine kinase
VEISIARRNPRDSLVLVLLVVKEAIHYAIKHAAPGNLSLELTATPDQLVVRLEDDGRGFDPSQVASRGNGLANMRRRIEDLGGTFQLESSTGRGTCMAWSVPLGR